ncbi:DUF1361 domain-containing protein [Pareuzebyella sediminis]|uniref:DUF1361 domain-containing protein n=1 Tax=Pareuzebyella sediminis TaxID=2607998 RepID=UPI0011EDD685|nr:DUF1361 domain-containing protein [Pareuzebyella sediminis]
MKTMLFKLDNRHLNLMLSIGFAVLLLILRSKIAHSIFYWFLAWNLFLAALPYMITQIMLRTYPLSTKKRFRFAAYFATWLLFLPNSPYIITDLIHLHSEYSHLVWLDLFMVFVFAANGLLLGLLSLMDMKQLLRRHFSRQATALIIFLSCLLSGYGIYLGRFLRFNSWDVLTKPLALFEKITLSLFEPNVWAMTFAFGGFMWILFLFFQSNQRHRPAVTLRRFKK